MNVLIVDDAAEIREVLQGILLLEVPAMEIVTAGDVQAAKAALQKRKPDVVVLDIQMPGGSGFDVLKMAKGMEAAPTVIMFTSFAEPEFREFSRKAGADYFLDKTREIERVAEICRDLSFGASAEAVC